jgi:DNA-binding transcriptional ArsR family regulator
MVDKPPKKLENIEANVKSHIVCSNLNRVCILHLLRGSENKEMQAERMAYRLGLSHRTVLYHLDILHDYELVEVRKFRKRGNKLMRSVWGLKNGNGHLDKVFTKIQKSFDMSELDNLINKNAVHQ